jgi:hypothetical protein
MFARTAAHDAPANKIWVLGDAQLGSRRSSGARRDPGGTIDEPVLERVARGLRPVRDAELAVDVRQVELHRLLRDPELLADRVVREAAGEGPQDRRLALGEAGGLGRVLGDAGLG